MVKGINTLASFAKTQSETNSEILDLKLGILNFVRAKEVRGFIKK